MDIIFLIIGIIVGCLIGFLIAKTMKKDLPQEVVTKINELEKSLEQVSLERNELDKEKEVLAERLSNAGEHFNSQKEKIQLLEEQSKSLAISESEWKVNYQNLKTKLEEQKQEFENLQEKFKVEFENIANKILDEKSTKFVAQNQQNLDQLLSPFNEKLKSFEDKVQQTYEKGLSERSALKEQILHLSELNQQMRKDAQNLTKALKQDTKTQGNWGEFILEKILQESGLKEGEEYTKQFSTTNDEGKRIQPDIIIQLPDDKHIIIDAKVSLVAYEQFISEEDDTQRESHLKNHLISVKNHIKGLSEKNYQTGENIHSPDFVLLFMPIEPAFSLAIQADHSIYQYAWDRKIVIVSPTTLLATLKTIASIWKQERQNKNILEIARQAAALYDKFVGFVSDMEKINKGISQADAAYKAAMNKLSEGSGNLIRSTEKIRKLGLTTKKQLPESFLKDQIE